MRIALLGDVALFGINTIGNVSYRDKFRLTKEILSGYDYVIANLETPLTDAKKTVGGKSAYIKGQPKDVEILKYIGITHVSLANNHIYDYLQQGVDDTIHALDSAGIKWFGLKGKTCEIIYNGTKIRLRGYCCYSTNAKGLKRTVDTLVPCKMESDIERDSLDGFITLLNCHWGQEHTHYPNYDHVILARKLSMTYPVIIQGHHPHVLQGIEKNSKSIVAYSLGNFCFDDVYTNKSEKPLIKLSEDNREAAILGITLNRNEVVHYTLETFLFDDSLYKKKKDIIDKVDLWSRYLKMDEITYRKKRDKEIDAYLLNRKRQRDLRWYIKRSNIDSLKMILSCKQNRKEYDLLVGNYIKRYTTKC